MKVTLDLAKLVEDRRLTPQEAERLKGLAAEATGSLAINVLIGFGVVAVAGGLVGLVPHPVTGLVTGFALAAAGWFVHLSRSAGWGLLAQILMVTGTLLAAAGVTIEMEGTRSSFLIVTAMFAIAGIGARSGLLVALSVLSLAGSLGAKSGYWHASYFVGVEQPLFTIAVFTGVALAAFNLSKLLKADYARLAIIASRTALFPVNFGFWIGSLWGDRLLGIYGGPQIRPRSLPVVIPDWAFVIAWAVVLVGAAMWAARANRPWVVNLAAVFGAIHFYTQWFERLGATPASILIAGVATLAFAIAMWRMNRARIAAVSAQGNDPGH
jgi:hypothetical protein